MDIIGHINFKTKAADIKGGACFDDSVVVLDGRLFNKKHVCSELGILGEATDEEVIEEAFSVWGNECVQRLNGDFAFVIYDRERGTLFAARDRMGVKPFFYKRMPEEVIFASTLKDLFKHPLCPAVLDKNGINEIFLLGPGRISGSGVFKDIEELFPGEYVTFFNGAVHRKQYFRLKAKPHTENAEETVQHLRELVTEAINCRLEATPGAACFLSGGLDSGIITSAVSEKALACGEAVATFSIDYKDNDKNFVQNSFQTGGDSECAAVMSKFAKTEHKVITLESSDVFDALKTAALIRGVPGMGDVDSALLLGCRAARKTHRVVFTGECADEFFGGYPWYFNKNALDKMMFPWAPSLDIRKRLLKKEFLIKEPEKYVRSFVQRTVTETDTLEGEDKTDTHIRRMFMLNVNWFMRNLLDRTDRMFRAAGLEASVPFCDYRIAEYAFNIPWKIKVLNGREKGLLREAFKDILPKEITERKKNPFPKTYDPEYYELVKEGAIRAVNRGGLLSKLINKEYFETLTKSPPEQVEPWYGQLMRLPQVFAMLIQMDYIFEEFNVQLAE